MDTMKVNQKQKEYYLEQGYWGLSLIHILNRCAMKSVHCLMQSQQEGIQMLLVCLIGLDIEPDPDRMAGKVTSKDGRILCSFGNGLIPA